jgi:RecA/RadA recombinase
MGKIKNNKLSPEEEVALIEAKMGYTTFERSASTYNYIDLGDKNFNGALGNSKYGVRVGSMIELWGPESSGKTTVATIIGAIGQSQNRHVYVAKGDLEGSDNAEFNKTMQVDMDRFYLFRAKIAASAKAIKRLKKLQQKMDEARTAEAKAKFYETYKKVLEKAEEFQETAQQVCKKIEKWIKYKSKQDPKAIFVLIMDSVTGLLTEEEMEGDLDNQNMRTNVSLATFLSKLCRRWVSFFKNYNVIGIFINQERTAPGVMFGNPTYTSGGKALKYYSSVRARIARVSGGRIKKHGRVYGIRTIITNIKNKTGEEGYQCGLKILTHKGKWEVMDVDKIKKEAKKEKYGTT